jgi:predicted metal-binding membrane protein
VISRRRDGARGLVVMGADHGLFCLGCCWALMLLMFAFATSSLVLMVGMAIYFFLEKIEKNGDRLSRWTGTLAISAGAVLIIRGFWFS